MPRKKWEDQSPAEKRVSIARDIVASVTRGLYYPEVGTYLDFDSNINKFSGDTSLQKVLKGKEVSCSVCAIGACFLSVIKFDNKLTIAEADKVDLITDKYRDNQSPRGRDRIEEYFSKEQLGLIEAAFETSAKYGEDSPERYEAVSFGTDFSTPESRLIGIMNNIIQNKGEFKP